MSRDLFCHNARCPCLSYPGCKLDAQLGAAMNRPEPVDQSLMSPTAPLPVVKPLFRSAFQKEKSHLGVPTEFLADVNADCSAQRAVLLEKAAEARNAFEEWQDGVLLAIFGMSREDLVANRDRITRHAHPDKDVYLLDGQPVVEIHRPRFNNAEFVATFKVLRTLP